MPQFWAMNLKKLHYFSGMVMAIFIGMHLANHLAALASPETHIRWMESLRQIYRNPVGETMLLLAVGIQIFTGLKLWRKLRKHSPSGFQKLQIYSGLYLSFFLLFHVGAVLSGRFVFGQDTNFWFGAAGLNQFPLNLFFIPYYSLAIFSVFGHIAAIHSQKMKYKTFGLSPEKQALGIFLAGIIIVFLVLRGMTNGFSGFEIPAGFDLLENF